MYQYQAQITNKYASEIREKFPQLYERCSHDSFGNELITITSMYNVVIFSNYDNVHYVEFKNMTNGMSFYQYSDELKKVKMIQLEHYFEGLIRHITKNKEKIYIKLL